ncbi:MAG: hypothetical protein C0407_03495 [Desulfobacca sp.]|nr:hypothetical protein [Desulfobacca sp.]
MHIRIEFRFFVQVTWYLYLLRQDKKRENRGLPFCGEVYTPRQRGGFVSPDREKGMMILSYFPGYERKKSYRLLNT